MNPLFSEGTIEIRQPALSGREPARERTLPRMRIRVAAAACFAVLAAVAIAQQFPLRQNVEVLTEAPMRPVKVKDGLYIIRGPAMPCMTGCRPGDKGDGLDAWRDGRWFGRGCWQGRAKIS